jgi:uncharacterized protein (DUF58 family)
MRLPKHMVRWKKRGMYFFLFGFLLLMASFNTGENLFYLVTCTMISFLFVAWFATRQSVRHLTVKRDAPEAVHRKESFAYNITLHNTRKFGAIRGITIASEVFDSPYYLDSIAASASIHSRLYATMHKRGYHPLPALQLSSKFPFGFFEQRSLANDGKKILVYPRIYKLTKQIMRELDDSGQTPRASTNNDGNEFYSLREYVPGDDIRHISWKTSARIGQLIIRELEPSVARMVVIVLDTRGLPATVEEEEQFDQVIDLAASLAIYLLEQHFSVGLVMPDAEVPVSKGQHQSIQILESLTLLDATQESEYGDDWHLSQGIIPEAAKVHLATRSTRWGMEIPQSRSHTLNPEKVLHG